MAIKWGCRPWKVWRSHWNNKTKLGGYRLPIALICAIIISCGLGYLAINNLAAWRDWQAFSPQTKLDGMIPFIPWMIVPYATLYLYYPMAAILGMKDEATQRENVIFHQIIILLTCVIFGIFLLMPAEVTIRSEVFEAKLGFWQTWYDLLHVVDSPWNAWPSLHIVQSLLVVLVINRWYSKHKNNFLIYVLWALWFLLALSILTIKQHFVWDLISGIGVAVISWKFWLLPALDSCQSESLTTCFKEL